MFTKAIVSPPSRNFAEGLTTADLGTPDYVLALEQHAAYCDALEACGLKLIRLEADEEFPDSCFVEDAAVVVKRKSSADYTDYSGEARDPSKGGPKARTSAMAVLTRPGALSRRGEVESLRGELSDAFPALDEIQSPGTLDGGDVCEAGTHCFIGISERTNEHGAQQLTDILATHGLTTRVVDLREVDGLLHLKSGIAYLGDRTLVITKALADRPEFQGYRLIRVETGEEYAANCIEVNGCLLIAAGHPRLEAKLRELVYPILTLDMSEFQKMDGGLSCLSVRW